MSKTFKDSKVESDYIIRLIQNSELMLCHEIEILETLAKKFNIQNLTDAAKCSNKTYNGMKKRVKQSKEMTVNLNGYQFISIN